MVRSALRPGDRPRRRRSAIPIAARWLDALGNVSFIERPFHPTTLMSVARSTIRGRRRQHETRSLLEDLRQGELRLQQINDQLERRVEERTAQLQHAHDELLAQIAERARTEDQLRQLQKLESIGQLTGGVAHDFNNLLTAVLGNLELLRKRLPHDPATERLLDGATQGAQRGAALTQRLLAFARRQALQPRPTDLAELVRGLADLLHRSLGPAIEIAVRPAGRLAAGLGGSQPDRARPAQSRGQRPRRHARWRHADHFALPRAGARGARSRGWPLCQALRLGYRLRHGSADVEPRHRAVLLDQGSRQGHGTGAVDDPWARAAAQRRAQAAERRRPRHAGRAVAAGRPWRRGGDGARLPAGGRCQQAAPDAALRRRRLPDQPEHRRTCWRISATM